MTPPGANSRLALSPVAENISTSAAPPAQQRSSLPTRQPHVRPFFRACLFIYRTTSHSLYCEDFFHLPRLFSHFTTVKHTPMYSILLSGLRLVELMPHRTVIDFQDSHHVFLLLFASFHTLSLLSRPQVSSAYMCHFRSTLTTVPRVPDATTALSMILCPNPRGPRRREGIRDRLPGPDPPTN